MTSIRTALLSCAGLFGAIACDDEPSTVSSPSEPQLEAARVATPSTPPPAAPSDIRLPSAVDLSGESAALAVSAVTEGPRLYARHLRAWIHAEPKRGSPRLGYIRAGSSVPITGEVAGTDGCKQGWRPIEPEGYLCPGRRATLERDDPVVRVFESHPPRFDQRLPYRYGTVRNPGPVYNRLPSRDELAESEPDYQERIPRWLDAGGEIGASFRPEVWEWGRSPRNAEAAWKSRLTADVPAALRQGDPLPNPTLIPRPTTVVLEHMKPRVGYAMLDTMFHEGRRYGLTTHLELVPTDRLRPIVGSEFTGVRLDGKAELPFAFVRRPGARYSDGSAAEYHAVLPLTGKRKFIEGRLHYETRTGKYISDLHASEVRTARKMPGWAKKGEKWISVSIGKQLLVLYEGTRPVYATLVSTGEAGLDSPEDSTATKRGIFRIHTKHVTTTMSSDEVGEEFELRDVPYVQYFADGGYALHGAYWHDRFGIPKSHGCINLSPEDARRIFHWTDPPVPPGWHAALSPLRGTIIFVHP